MNVFLSGTRHVFKALPRLVRCAVTKGSHTDTSRNDVLGDRRGESGGLDAIHSLLLCYPKSYYGSADIKYMNSRAAEADCTLV